MAKSNLIEQLIFTLKMFARIFLFSLIAYMMVSCLDLNPITGYKVIIFSALIGAIMGVYDVIQLKGK